MLLALAAGGALLEPALSSEVQPTGGVVVEEATRSFAGHAAGLQPGDVIDAWSRAANPPANARAAEGEIHTPFDLVEVEIEQAPRGALTLKGTRQGVPARWVVPPDHWRLRVRPVVSEAVAQAYAAGAALVEAGQEREGAARWRTAARETGVNTPPWLAAWLALRSAEVLAKARAFEQADEAYADAARLTAEAPLPGARAQVLRAWARSLAERNRAEAVSRLADALAAEERRMPESLAVALTQSALAQERGQEDHHAEGAARFARALALAEAQAPGSQAVADVLSGAAFLGLSILPRGPARQLAERARSLREALAPGSVALAGDLARLAWFDQMDGDARAAAAGFGQAIARLEESAPASPEMVVALRGMGQSQQRLSNLGEADAFYRRVAEVRRRMDPRYEMDGDLLARMGQTAASRYDAEMAHAYFQQALVMFRKEGRGPSQVRRALHGLGDAALVREDYPAAEEYFRRALAGSETLKDLETPADLRCLGWAEALQGRFEAGQQHVRRALDLWRQVVPGTTEVASSLNTAGEIALMQGDLETSLEHFEESLALRSRLMPGSLYVAEPLYGLGRIHRRAGRLVQSAAALSRALAVVEQQGARLEGSEESRANFGSGHGGYFHEYLEVLLELGDPAAAFLALERSRARSLLAMLAERRVLLDGGLPPELAREREANHEAYDRVQADLLRLTPGQDEAQAERLRARLRELREEAGHIVTRARQASPRAASLQYPEPLGLADARAALDPGTTLLAYAVGREVTTLFALPAEGLPGTGLSVFTLPVGRKALREKVASFRRAIEASGGSAPRAEAAALYDLLVRPAEPAIAQARRVVITPDGALHVLPFSALVRRRPPGAARYLVEWKPIHVVASATVYAEVKKTRTAPPARRTMAAFGDPRYPASSGERPGDPELTRAFELGLRLPPLPASRREVETIAALFPGARTFLGREATEERVKEVARGTHYLHIASHGLLDERLPLNSGLAMSIPDLALPGKDNGLLQAWEIFDGLRIDAELVTLSACQTGLGKDRGGEGLLGLTRAFQFAGARSVLASLWSVPDRSTSRLMRRFYGFLAAGQPKDEALRAAQLGLLRSGGAGSHPRHWAGFALFGDWR